MSDYTEAKLAQLRDSAECERQFVYYRQEDKASLGALLREIYMCADGASDFAHGALEQLSFEITGLRALLASDEGADLNDDIIGRIAGGIEHRARVAAEAAKTDAGGERRQCVVRPTVFNHEKALRGLLGEVLRALGSDPGKSRGRAMTEMLDQLGFEFRLALERIGEAEDEERGAAIISLQGVQRRLELIRSLSGHDPTTPGGPHFTSVLDYDDAEELAVPS
jgi:hypothetical protein